MIVVLRNTSRRSKRRDFFTYSFRFDCRISFTFLKVNFQNIYIDNLFDLCYNNIQVVRLFLVYLYLFISAKNDGFYRYKAEFDVPATYPLRCASCTAYFFRSASLIRMITVSKVCKLTLLRMLQPLTDRLKHSSFISLTHP